MKKIFLLISLSLVSVLSFAQEKPEMSEREKQLLKEREQLELELEALKEQQKELLEKQQELLEKQREKSEVQREKAEEKRERAEEERRRVEEAAEKEVVKAPNEVEIPEVPEIEDIEPVGPAPKVKRKDKFVVKETDDGTKVKILGIEVEDGDSTIVKIGNKVIVADGEDVDVRITVNDDEGVKSRTSIEFFTPDRNRVFQGFEFGFIGLSYDKSFDTDVPDDLDYMEMNVGKSINWALNFAEMDIRIIKEYFKFSTGLGYNVKNFSFQGDSYLMKDDNDSIVGIDSGQDLKKNRLRVGYLTVPAMIYANTHADPDKAFRLGVGVQGGLKIYQTYRTKYFDDDHKVKSRQNGGWNTRDFILDGRAVVGYGPINVYASYAMASLFKKDKGPEVYPYMVGVSFVNIF